MYKNVLVPISLEEGRDTETALNVGALLAGEGGKVGVLHVVEELPGYVAEYLPTGQMAANMAAVETKLEEMVAGRPGFSVAVVSGHSGRTILDYAEDKGVECIVLASHKPGMQDYFLGSTAARVVRHAKCAVHVVR